MNYNRIVSVIFGLLLLVPAGNQIAFAGSECAGKLLGTFCDDGDGNPCTGICDGFFGICTDGARIAGVYCEDGDGEFCTGTCNALGTCTSAPKPAGDPCDAFPFLANNDIPGISNELCLGACDGAGSCKANLDVAPGNFCGSTCSNNDGICIPGISEFGLFPIPSGDVVCVGQTFKPLGSECKKGFLIDFSSCQQSASCQQRTDGTLFCKLIDEPAGTSCDDGDACTGIDQCDDDGSCISPSPLNCDDGITCTGTETCDPDIGCLPGVFDDSLCVDDGNPCTTEFCDAEEGCRSLPVTCLDFNTCDGISVCNPATGQCENDPNTAMNDCDDGNVCNGGEICAAGSCITDPFDQPIICPNFGLCDGESTCDPILGCVNGPPLDCNDDNSCTFDSCFGSTCLNFAATGTSCDDGNACTTGDICGGASGIECVGGTPVDCGDDGNACTGTETCDTATGQCVVTSPPVVCNDGNVCIGLETCNATTGQCEPSTPRIFCDDGNVCNGREFCNSSTGLCAMGISLPGDQVCAIGGSYVPIETTPVLIAGAQMTTSWLIPVLVAGAGIGLVLLRRK